MLNLTAGAIKPQVPFLISALPQTQLGLTKQLRAHISCFKSVLDPAPDAHTVILTLNSFQTLARTKLCLTDTFLA